MIRIEKNRIKKAGISGFFYSLKGRHAWHSLFGSRSAEALPWQQLFIQTLA
jgi:hypothetical protein